MTAKTNNGYFLDNQFWLYPFEIDSEETIQTFLRKVFEHGVETSELKQITAKMNNGLFLDKQFWL